LSLGREPLVEGELADVAGQHDDHADRALPLIEELAHRAERGAPVALPDRVGQLEDAALAGVGDERVDVLDGDRGALAGEQRELLDGPGQARQVLADDLLEAPRRVGRHAGPEAPGLLADPRGHLAGHGQLVDHALLLGRGEELEAAVDLAAQEEQHGLGAGRVEVGHEAGQGLGARRLGVTHQHQAALAHHGQGARRAEDLRRARALALDPIEVEGAAGRRHGRVEEGGDGALREQRVGGGDHVNGRQLAAARVLEQIAGHLGRARYHEAL
jgi:hypothetical protein